MKLIKKRALEIAIELWGWLAKNPSKGKDDFPKFDEYELDKMHSECPLCEFYGGYMCLDCSKCPINKAKNNCFDIDSAFYKWDHGVDSVENAQKIADICKKALEKLTAKQERLKWKK